MLLGLPEGGRVVRAFGFDVDGVLRDTAHSAWQSLCKTVDALGGTPPSHDAFVRGYTPDFLTYYRGCGVRADRNRILEVYRGYQDVEDLAEPFFDVAWFLNLLQTHGVPAFVVSSSRLQRVEEWLVRHGLRDRFLHVASASADKRESLLAACKALNVIPEEACYLGDLGHDMQAARAVGVIPVGITREYETDSALTECGAARVVPHFAHLAAYIFTK